MTLAHAWSRRMFNASLVALLVPGAVVAALVPAAMTGGLSRIGDLSQVFGGPRVPSVPPAVPARHARSRPASRVSSRRAPSAAPHRAVATGPVTRSGSPVTVIPAPGAGVSAGRNERTVGPGASRRGGGGRGSGSTATNVLQQVGAAVDKVLPTPSPAKSVLGDKLP